MRKYSSSDTISKHLVNNMSRSSVLKDIAAETGCEIRQDALTRTLYATDASLYLITPCGVAFPRSAQEVAGVLAAANAAGIPVHPRGAGTGLAGGALGEGLVIDTSRYMNRILSLNPGARYADVEPGVVLDTLNSAAAAHELTFGPDVATSSRATLGGMIANNSSGARALRYGVTIDHVESVEIALADGRRIMVGTDGGALGALQEKLENIIRPHAETIREKLHEGIVKRWQGFALDRFLRTGKWVNLFGGSEGTLGVICAARLRLVPLPPQKGLALIFFDSVLEAMQATVELLPLKPSAIEHIDDVLFNQTRGQVAFAETRAFLGLDATNPKAILIVEFTDSVAEKLDRVQRMRLGTRTLTTRDSTEMAGVWNLRKAGLNLLTGCPGPRKPIPGIEDVAVPVANLPQYVSALRALFDPLSVEASFYGHAGAGLLHVRPVLNLRDPEDRAKYRKIADEVSRLTLQFKGALAAEHGVGIARTEYMRKHLGDVLDVMAEIKRVLDPKNTLNPGKIFGEDVFRIDSHLRVDAAESPTLPFESKITFQSKDHSFLGNLEQCNGAGACRKLTPTMCPTYIATGDEIMSTRGRANTIRAVLEGRLRDAPDPLLSPALDTALKYCLSCKACKTECPSNVDMALLKADLLFAKLSKYGVPLHARLLSRPDLLGRWGTRFPRFVNAIKNFPFVHQTAARVLDLAPQRPLPDFAPEDFRKWFARRSGTRERSESRGTVYLWDDCFARFYESSLGKATVAVLEAAGFTVRLLETRVCCGRPAFSLGRLDLARQLAETNAAVIQNTDPNAAVLFLEPSCFSMVYEDYLELGIESLRAHRGRFMLLETFLARLLDQDKHALVLSRLPRTPVLHVHCHARALGHAAAATKLVAHFSRETPTVLNTGCCGMAGSFGYGRDQYALSCAVGAPLAEQITRVPEGVPIIAGGTSCRHQIEHLARRRALHIAEWLAEGLHSRG